MSEAGGRVRRGGTVLFGTLLLVVPLLLALADEKLGLPRFRTGAASLLAWPLALASLFLFADCTRRYRRVSGSGVPLEPPPRLVLSGFYGRCRNPFYLASILWLFALFFFFGYAMLLVYAVFLALAFHLVVVFHEEPLLRSRFGEAYERYLRAVPRWVPRLREPR
ncbi:MAG: hypothetical protein KatS3mg076_1830 [Candidatus Binatia bacterium]|nr:MAG: hypothetical protein KatS3mg076_1830 [Candidatus Binatia bacterium]